MKKFMALFLALMMVFMLAACDTGSNDDKDDGKNSNISDNTNKNNGGVTDSNDNNAGGDTSDGGNKVSAYKSAVERMMEAQFCGNDTDANKLAPADFWTRMGEYFIEEITWGIGSMYEENQYMYGDDFTISTTITEKADFTSAEYDLVVFALSEYQGINAASITAIKQVAVKVAITGDTSTEVDVEMAVAEIDDAWYCINVMMYEGGCYADFYVQNLGGFG